MKRPILLSILVIAAVFSFCYWGPAPSKPVSGQAPATDIAAKKDALPIPVATPASMGQVAARVAPVRPVTDDRRRIYDSPDIMATINDIRRNGTQDQKDWALTLLSDCVQIFARPVEAIAQSETSEQARPASSPDNAETAARKRQASEILADRCKGIKQLSAEDRRAIRQELTEGHLTNPSALGQLQAIHDDRWSGEQAKLITESIYGGDPIIAREAFLELRGAFDPASPGGGDRQIAFTLALAPTCLNFPLSEFERLDACRSMDWCGSTWGSQEPYTPSPEVQRLVNVYKDAAQSHMDARGILAIR